MNKFFHRILICILFFVQFANAQTVTFPKNDVNDVRQNVYAFQNATIFIDHANKLEKATLLIKGDRILQVGQNVTLPKEAVIFDLKGKFIYPSFIETESDYGMPEVKRAQGGYYNFENDSKKKGPFAWNQAIQPENDAVNLFAVNAKTADEMRKIGFGTVITHPHDGIARGTSILVALIDDREQNAVLRTKLAAHYSFSKGSSGQSYPSSMMGSVALLRQTYYDAEWYKNQKNNTEFNISLASFNQNQTIPQVFEATDKAGIFRADGIGDEFKKQYIMVTGGDEYQRINDIKKTGASLIVPLNFPAAYDVDDPLDAKAVSLAEMKHWELAPTNPASLAKAGIDFSLTTAQNKNKADFISNLRKAIENGLTEQDALKSLTTTPAKLFNISDLAGSLKAGLLANFLISEKNIFAKENVIFENWIKGKRHILADINITDIRGKYKANFGAENFILNITGKNESPEYAIVIADTIKVTPKVTRNGDFITLKYAPQKSSTIENRISGFFAGNQIKGKGEAADGTEKNFFSDNYRTI